MKNIVLERDDMSEFERSLFLKDLKKVPAEYFETETNPALEITRTENGFLVCVIFSARRIKSVKQPL